MTERTEGSDLRAEKGVSVVIPTYNEAPCLGVLLEGVSRSLRDLSVPAEVIVVDDHSPDGTAEIAERRIAGYPFPLRLERRRGPRSLSLSVVAGAARARYSCVAVLDADLSHNPADLARIVEPVLSGEVDISIGSRYAPGGAISRWPLHRRLVSGFGTCLARVLTRARDPLSGFFATRKALLAGSAVLRPRGYKILLEILGRHRGLRVAEVPICFQDRHAGESKFGLRQGLEFLLQAFSLFLSRWKPRPECREAQPWAEEASFSTAPHPRKGTFLETHS